MHVVIVGSGKIGCGFLAPLFSEAGHRVTVACRTADTAERIRCAAGWTVRLTRAGTAVNVPPVEAVAVGTPASDAAIAAADLLVTAVGVGNVRALAPSLVAGLADRGDRPLDIWVVENDACADALRDALADVAAVHGRALPPLGIAGAVAYTTVGRGSWHEPGRPVFVGDQVRRMAVDATRLRSPMPRLPEVWGTRQYPARLAEKLYVFNAGHALTAYLGWLRGHDTIAASITDPLVRPLVAGALLEARHAVLSEYPQLRRGVHPDGLGDVREPVAEILSRYGDEELADPLTRVARDPIRKLSAGDRLMGPVRLMRRNASAVPSHFALGVAAALLYGHTATGRCVDDVQASELRTRLARRGLLAVLAEVSELEPDDGFTQAVAYRYRRFVFLDDGVRFPPVQPGTREAAPAPFVAALRRRRAEAL